MRNKFVRYTHVNGKYREDMRALWEENRTAGVFHFFSRAPMSFDEVVAEINKYHDDFYEPRQTPSEIALDMVREIDLDLIRVVEDPR